MPYYNGEESWLLKEAPPEGVEQTKKFLNKVGFCLTQVMFDLGIFPEGLVPLRLHWSAGSKSGLAPDALRGLVSIELIGSKGPDVSRFEAMVRARVQQLPDGANFDLELMLNPRNAEKVFPTFAEKKPDLVQSFLKGMFHELVLFGPMPDEPQSGEVH